VSLPAVVAVDQRSALCEAENNTHNSINFVADTRQNSSNFFKLGCQAHTTQLSPHC